MSAVTSSGEINPPDLPSPPPPGAVATTTTSPTIASATATSPAPAKQPHPAPKTETTTPSHGSRKKAKVKESVIDHTYRDFSRVKVSSDDENDDGKAHNRPNFPSKLHAIVSNPNYRHIICWLPHGRSWKIVDKFLLVSVIIPQHFAHSKFESFNRSVNGWGFKVGMPLTYPSPPSSFSHFQHSAIMSLFNTKRLLNPGPDCKSYYHECFLRGRPELTKMMERLVNPGKRLPDKSGEPDFYDISKSFPLPEPLPLPMPPPDPSLEWKGPDVARSSTMYLPQPGQQPFVFTSPLPPHASGYNHMYGYPQVAPHPSMPSPAKSANQEQNPPDQPQQMYWQNPGEPTQFQHPPPPSPYGYYQYPMMMPQMMAGPQGYYFQQPYPPQAAAMHNPYFPPGAVNPTPQGAVTSIAAPSLGMKPAGPAAPSPVGDMRSVSKPEVLKQDAKPMGVVVTPPSTSDSAAQSTEESTVPAVQTGSDGEANGHVVV